MSESFRSDEANIPSKSQEMYRSLVRKKPNELAGQTLESFPTSTSYQLPDYEAREDRLRAIQSSFRDFLANERPTGEQIMARLAALEQQSQQEFIARPQDDPASLAALSQSLSRYSKDTESARIEAQNSLESHSYVEELRRNRRDKEKDFNEAFNSTLGTSELSSSELERLAVLEQTTFDLEGMSEQDKLHINQDFPSGNFLFHGAKTKQLLEIIQSGSLMNVHALYRAAKQQVQQDGSGVQAPFRNSGYEGISWSMNTIDALPGDRFHMAGFLASPEAVLSDAQQLAVPSRPAPHEVIQIDRAIDADTYYQVKTQEELLMEIGFGESNSVFASIFALKNSLERFRKEGTYPEEDRWSGVPLVLDFVQHHSDEEIIEILQSKYSVRENGTIHLDPSLLQQSHTDMIPTGAVYLQALLDQGRLSELPGLQESPTSLRELVLNMTEQTIPALLNQARHERDYLATLSNAEEGKIDDIEIDTEDMYFVCPRKDMRKWQLAFARLGHSPKGILLYDDKTIRMENFASEHEGDQAELSSALQGLITQKPGYLDYETEVLGTQITPEKRAGHRKQVIGEQHLTNRKAIVLESGQLTTS